MTQLAEPMPDSEFADVPLLTEGAIRERAASGGAPPGPGPDPVPPEPPPVTGADGIRPVPEPDAGPDRPALRNRLARAAKAGLAIAGLLLALAAVCAAAAFLTFPRLVPPAWAGRLGHLGQHELSWLIPAAAFAALAAALGAWKLVRRLVRGQRTADVLTLIAACVASVVSATGMWAVFTSILHLDPVLRDLLFPFIELAVISCAVQARDNMRDAAQRDAGRQERGVTAGREDKGIDVDRLAMWGFTCLTAFLSSLAASGFAEHVFRFAPPLVAAWLWERRLVSERRRITLRRGEQADWLRIARRALRLALERPLVRAGLAEPAGRVTGDLAARRLITQLALATERAAALKDAGASTRQGGQADKRLRAATRLAVEHTDLATNPLTQRELVDQLAILSGYKELTSMAPDAPWATLTADRQAALGPPKDQRRRGRRDEQRQDEQDQDDPRGEQRQDDERRRDEQDQPPADSTFSGLADHLTLAIRQADPDGAARIHYLLSTRDDHEDLIRWLGNRGKFGDKRLMALAALYATRDLVHPSAVSDWIAGLVPGKPGQVDKAEIRRFRDRIAPAWRARNFPPQGAAGDSNETESQ